LSGLALVQQGGDKGGKKLSSFLGGLERKRRCAVKLKSTSEMPSAEERGKKRTLGSKKTGPQREGKKRTESKEKTSR